MRKAERKKYKKTSFPLSVYLSFSHFIYFCFHIQPCDFPESLIHPIVFSCLMANTAGLRHHFCFLLSQWIMYTEQWFINRVDGLQNRLTFPWDPELGSSTATVSTESTAMAIKAKAFLFCRGQPCDTWSLREYFRPCSLRLSPVLYESFAWRKLTWEKKKKVQQFVFWEWAGENFCLVSLIELLHLEIAQFCAQYTPKTTQNGFI